MVHADTVDEALQLDETRQYKEKMGRWRRDALAVGGQNQVLDHHGLGPLL